MNMKNKIAREALAFADGKVIKEARIGLGYTSVLLDSGEMGLAYTFHNDLNNECTVYRGVRPIAGNPASTIIKMLDSDDYLEIAVALATANALLNNREQDYTTGDILDSITLYPDDTACMIGNFMPVVKGLKSRVASLNIFERNENLADGLLSAEKVFDYLPRSSVAIITSTTLINSTIDPLLEAAKDCREVIMLGASTPLCPAVFNDSPVTLLSGVVVRDREKVFQTISEGGGMKIFKQYINKVSLKL